MNPKVSVVMVTHNQERYIAQAIESVVAQETPFPIEILIADDRSTDATGEIVLEFARRNPNTIRPFIRATNLGPNENGRRLMPEARGEYLAWLDGDDYWTSP
jgi:glycosyltransferase involved in cell wall biosynthesis